MNILMLSWRDIKNPKAGGAEIVTFELLRRFAACGHSCTWFASHFPGSSQKEVIEGVNVIRQGGRIGVYFRAYSFLKGRKFDCVIDQVNTLPFFTPLYYRGRKIAFFHQLCENIWFYEMYFPLALIGFLAEKFYVPLYHRYPTMTVSNSTRRNLEKYGFHKVMVFRNCLDSKPLPAVPFKERYMLIYVGRLKKSKRVHDIIKALYLVRKQIEAELHIIGRGDSGYEKKLNELVSEYGMQTAVFFHGFLSKTKRNELLEKSEALVMASVKEGWGLVVIEAAAHGTASVVYNVDGLRDSVISGHTGLITKENTPESLAAALISFLRNEKLKKKLAVNALEYSKRFDWDESFKDLKEFIETVGK